MYILNGIIKKLEQRNGYLIRKLEQNYDTNDSLLVQEIEDLKKEPLYREAFPKLFIKTKFDDMMVFRQRESDDSDDDDKQKHDAYEDLNEIISPMTKKICKSIIYLSNTYFS